MWKIIKLLFWILAPPGICAFGLVLFSEAGDALHQSAQCRLAAAAFLAGIFFWLVLGRFLQFFHVFVHEMTHLFVGLLFFRKPRRLIASAGGGQVEMVGGNFIINLAPYFFPLLSFGLVVVYPLLDKHYTPYFCAALGFVTGYHVIAGLQEFKPGQPDIRETGLVFALMFCILGNVVVLGFILGFLKDGFTGGWRFLQAGLKLGAAMALMLADAVRPLLP